MARSEKADENRKEHGKYQFGFRDILLCIMRITGYRIMETQMGKKMENERELGSFSISAWVGRGAEYACAQSCVEGTSKLFSTTPQRFHSVKFAIWQAARKQRACYRTGTASHLRFPVPS